MPNRQLSSDEQRTLAAPLLGYIRDQLKESSAGDPGLLFALRRKIAKELMYDERSKPMVRRRLKAQKLLEQKGLCKKCSNSLPEYGSVLDRINAIDGYTTTNVQLL